VSAISELRAAVVAGQADIVAPSAIALAVLELADQVAELQARVFPPPPASSDPVVVMAQPMSVDKPQLGGS
jgi:hypothetical protein